MGENRWNVDLVKGKGQKERATSSISLKETAALEAEGILLVLDDDFCADASILLKYKIGGFDEVREAHGRLRFKGKGVDALKNATAEQVFVWDLKD